MKICLIHCGNVNITAPSDNFQKNAFYLPMGMVGLAALIEDNGYQVEIIHGDIESGKELSEIIDLDSINVIGLDLHWINQCKNVIDTAAYIKKKNSSIFIFIGGYSASFFANEILQKYTQIDAIIKGDAEVPLINLLQVLHDEPFFKDKCITKELSDNMTTIPNLSWRDKFLNVKSNAIGYVADSNDLSNLDFARINLLRNWEVYRTASSFYSHFKPISNHAMFLAEIGRGCEYACAYCGGNHLAQKIINNRTNTSFRSVNSVIETIEKAYSNNFKTIYLSLESEESEAWYFNLLDEIKDKNLDICIGLGAWKLPSKNMLKKVSESCVQAVIEISPESGDETIRQRNKDRRIYFSNNELEDFLDNIKSFPNLKAQIFFGFYCSNDSESYVIKTLEYILDLLSKYPNIIEIEYSNFSSDPASLFYLYPEKYQLNYTVNTFEDYVYKNTACYNEENYQTADLTFFKPSGIEVSTDNIIRTVINQFNTVISTFRMTLSYYCRQKGNLDIIKQIINSGLLCNCIEMNYIKDVLYKMLSNDSKLDNITISILNNDYEQSIKNYKISKPTKQLYIDYLELDDFLNKNYIYSQSKFANQVKDEGIFNF